MTSQDRTRLLAAYHIARDALLAERNADGFWVGELSSSALSSATAVIALHFADSSVHSVLIHGGLKWIDETQNPDGGWGDTTKSFSNISTSMLIRAAFAVTGTESEHSTAVNKLEGYLTAKCGTTPAERAEAIRNRYGKDRTFSVPILMTCALAGLVPWKEVPRLPFELACLPQSWYRFAGLPVVSYALPALIAIGQCVHAHRPTWWNPLRRLARGRSLKVLRRIQPSSGGYLEAAPLTSFVVMGLIGASRTEGPAVQVVAECVRFLIDSVRPDGSWPIDTNLSIWVTTLSVNALAAADDLASLPDKDITLAWLFDQQTKEQHPYTGAPPGGWAWSHCPGSVPDCDDTPGAIIACTELGRHLTGDSRSRAATEGGPYRALVGAALRGGQALPLPRRTSQSGNASTTLSVEQAIRAGRDWVINLQNSNGGFPTFCRGWGKLPFDRSGNDLTAHTLRSLEVERRERMTTPKRGFWTLSLGDTRLLGEWGFALLYLADNQRPDGSWLPLWFGNQHAPDDENPVYGTARVLAAYRDLGLKDSPECHRGVNYLLSVQNPVGGWGGALGCPSSVEETALAVEVLIDLSPGDAVARGLAWLVAAVESGRFRDPSPIGFYFAKLWYFEKLYPLIFTVAALGRATRSFRQTT
ncbi:MAG TPA: prenyltransferase/squalene oxidase repeat-containing protein [Fimbriiglobus sp.]|jgi:squalene-hopene/tetraprenyl-beta-curcumene cyclase